MFDTGCVLSGSRALEYFVPGSARPGSDWDFYVPGYKESVADMINVLIRCGVTWNLEAANISTELLNGRSVTVSSRTIRTLNTWILDRSPEAAVDLLGKETYDVVMAFKALQRDGDGQAKCYDVAFDSERKVRLQAKVSKSVIEEDISYEDPMGRSFSILQGQIDTPRGSQRVQLIIGNHYGNSRGCMSFIKSFYASHVQCFVGGWCASHMYYRQAQARRATLWEPHPSQQADKVTLAIQKYQERGYSFTPTKAMPKPHVRRLRDDSSIFFDYGHVYEPYIPPGQHHLLSLWLDERRENVASLSWVEVDGRISVFSPMESCVRQCQRTFAAGVGLGWSRQCRLADIVALAAEREGYIRDGKFRSSVSLSLRGEHWEVGYPARSGTVYAGLSDATPWSWVL
jgi:hypothetical protein